MVDAIFLLPLRSVVSFSCKGYKATAKIVAQTVINIKGLIIENTIE
ncbi:MAG: hypothetical protein ACJAXH_003575 [Colwellia sp.]